MSDLMTTQSEAQVIESVVIGGDLSKLTPGQRVSYYQSVCHSLRLNPLTRPFDYITLNGRLTLYARKDATEQLRRLNNISIDKPEIQFQDEWIIVTVVAEDSLGRKDSDIGVVNKKDMQGNFGNALMKAVTKAKRRVTLSICGLGMLDETEVETIPEAKIVTVDDDGEIIDAPAGKNPEPISDAAWKEWMSLKSKAMDQGVEVPEVHRERITTQELREVYGELRKKVHNGN